MGLRRKSARKVDRHGCQAGGPGIIEPGITIIYMRCAYELGPEKPCRHANGTRSHTPECG